MDDSLSLKLSKDTCLDETKFRDRRISGLCAFCVGTLVGVALCCLRVPPNLGAELIGSK